MNKEITLDGIFEAKVLDNKDPYNSERLLVSVGAIHAEDVGVWAEHVCYSNNVSGDVPMINDTVYVMFLKDFNGDCSPFRCVWVGMKVNLN